MRFVFVLAAVIAAAGSAVLSYSGDAGEVDDAVLVLEEAGVVASPSGAAALAGLMVARRELALPRDACVAVLCTEGPLR